MNVIMDKQYNTQRITLDKSTVDLLGEISRNLNLTIYETVDKLARDYNNNKWRKELKDEQGNNE